jgi:probable HAF family extracellular repeat protein
MGMRDLGLGPFVTGINNSGQVTGYFRTEHSIHAYITGPDGEGIRDIGTTPGGSMSHAWGINDSGQVVGHVTYELPADPFNEVVHAFITGPNGEGIRDLGTLAGHTLDDRHFSGAVDINDVGQVVGWSRTAEGPRHAFITGPDGEGMMDLNLLVDLPQAVILTEATGINNNGQVIAVGIVPEPETYALMFAGLGLIGFMMRRRKAVQND